MSIQLKVMSHRHFMNGLSAAQYFSYLVVGVWYFSVFGTFAGIKTGGSFIGLGPVLVPLLLGGYASALSLFMPRVASVVAFACAVPYLLLSILGLRITAQGNWFFLIPSTVIMGVSIVAFLWSEGSVWRGRKTRLAKVAIALVAALPALFATWWVGAFLFGLISAYSSRAR